MSAHPRGEEQRFCRSCERVPLSKGSPVSFCSKCREFVFSIADECLRRFDRGSNSVEDENAIDSLFYFDIACLRWKREVKELSQRLFGTIGPPRLGNHPDDIPPLVDPFARVRAETLDILEATDSWAAAQLTPSAAGRIESLKVRPQDAARWWQVMRLGQPYGIPPEDVWIHLVTGKDVQFPLVEIAIGWNRFAPARIGIIAHGAMALPKSILGLPDDDPLVDWMRERAGKGRRQACQRAAKLVRTWTCYCLERLATMEPSTVVAAWNERYGDDKRLRWPPSGLEQYAGDKTTLRRRLDYLLDDELLGL